MKVLQLDSLTAHHLLRRYLFPEDFLQLDLDREAAQMMDLSRNQHGRATLIQLQVLARHTIGIELAEVQQRAQRLSARAWLSLIETFEAELRRVASELIRLSNETPYHAPLTSLKGVSDLLAALFLAELRDPTKVTHPRQIERLAGLNLYVHDSGTYQGRRRISHLGNARLRWVLYRMASETTKYVPEIRSKYLRRYLCGQMNRTKKLVSTIPQLLSLVMALVREERLYEERPAAVAEMRRLERELEGKQPAKRTRRRLRSEGAAA